MRLYGFWLLSFDVAHVGLRGVTLYDVLPLQHFVRVDVFISASDGELTDDNHAGGYADEEGVEVVPPVVGHGAHSLQGGVDAEGGGYDAGAEDGELAEEAGHLAEPASAQF